MLNLTVSNTFRRGDPNGRTIMIRVEPEGDLYHRSTRGYTIQITPKAGYLRFLWFGRWETVPDHALQIAVSIVAPDRATQSQPWVRATYFGVHIHDEMRLLHIDSHVDAPHNWPDLIALGRWVGHSRSPLPFLGWIEDHLPEPWSLLASPEPIEAFRALSPIPLYTGEEDASLGSTSRAGVPS